MEGEVKEIQSRQHRDSGTGRGKILNQYTNTMVPDPLYLIPESLKVKEPTVPSPVLPDLPLPEPDSNVLEEILQQERLDPFAVESREDEKMELMKDTFNVLKELLHSTRQIGQLLTMLNTGLRKNTMVLQELNDLQRRQREDTGRWRRDITPSPQHPHKGGPTSDLQFNGCLMTK